MLPSVRKDLEELEAHLDLIQSKQGELEAALSALRVHLTSVVQGTANNLDADIALKFQEQSKWLASTLSHFRSDLLEQSQLDKSESIAVLTAIESRGRQQADSLRSQFTEQIKAAQTRHEELLRDLSREFGQRLDELERAGRERAELEIDDVSPQSLQEWSELVGTRLKRFGESQGMARSFARQLLQELKELTDLNRQLADEQTEWSDRLDELQRVLWASDRVMPWTCLTPHNSTAMQRSELRALETAVAQMRSYVQENLLQKTGIRPLEIVPRSSPFDASVHESNEFLEVPTDDEKKHNLILSVEQAGFQKTSPWSETQLLRPARVRRFVLQNESAPQEVEIAAGEEDALVEDAPRVLGQL